MQLKLLTMAAASVGAVAGFFIAVAFWAVQEWAQPLEPMLFLGLALFAVYGVLIGAWVSVTRKEAAEGGPTGGASLRARSFQRLTALMAQVLLGVLALLLSSLWALDAVRVQALEAFADRGPSLYMRALQDPSARVAAQACDFLFEASGLKFEKYLTAELVRRPGVAAKCLSTARQKERFGVDYVANGLMAQWRNEVLRADVREKAFACERAAQFTVVAELSQPGAADPALLECSLTALDGGVRQCCAQQLGARGDLATHIGLNENLTPTEAAELYPAIVEQAFRAKNLNPDDQAVAASLSFDTEARRLWALQFGCALFGAGQQREAIRGWLPIIEGSTCNLSEQGRIEFTRVEPWVFMCPYVEEMTTDKPVEAALCTLMEDSMVDNAIRKAEGLVMAAVSAMFLEASADTLDDGGRAMASAARSSNPFAAENIRISSFERPPRPVNPYSADKRCYRMTLDSTARLDRLRRGDPEVFKVESTYDCDGKWADDYTVADLQRDRKSMLKSAVRDGGVKAGDTSKIEKERGANSVKTAREKMKTLRDGSK